MARLVRLPWVALAGAAIAFGCTDRTLNGLSSTGSAASSSGGGSSTSVSSGVSVSSASASSSGGGSGGAGGASSTSTGVGGGGGGLGVGELCGDSANGAMCASGLACCEDHPPPMQKFHCQIACKPGQPGCGPVGCVVQL